MFDSIKGNIVLALTS